MKPPDQLIETLESKKQPTKKTLIRPCAQTYHKFNVVYIQVHELPCSIHDALKRQDLLEW
jgi:hypothetical protein